MNASHFSPIVCELASGIPERLKMVQGGRSLRKWADDLNIPHQNLSRYMRGSTPDIRFLVLLGWQGEADMNWLLTGKLGDERSAS